MPLLLTGVGREPVAVTGPAFTDSGTSVGAATTHTVAGRSFGAADATRIIAASIAWVDTSFGGSTLNSVTIGGVSATRAIRSAAAGNFNNAEIWYAAVPTGTTGDVVLTFSNGSVSRVSVGVYSLINLVSGTPSHTGTGTTTASISVVNGDFVVAVGCRTNDSVDYTLSNVTIDADLAPSSSHRGIHGHTTATSTTTLTVVPSVTSNAPQVALASWA